MKTLHLTTDQIVDLLYGEAEEDRSPGREHIDQCAVCRDEFSRLARAQQALDHSAQESPPEDGRAIRNESAAIQVLRAAAVRAQRSRAVWTRCGVAAVCIGVMLSLFAAAQVRVEWRGRQLIVQWGDHLNSPSNNPTADHSQSPQHFVSTAGKSSADTASMVEMLVSQRRQLDELSELLGIVVEQMESEELRFARWSSTAQPMGTVRPQRRDELQPDSNATIDWQALLTESAVAQ
ncbi:MAG: hypothetical protein QGG36_22570 [Pirellulaceae bacterium]|jgi:hypothetical protein|nr:hypothetical protein [Pirellulaceae bacterium]MDP7018600.1 hypothetical protein [Pirellulaceae bacterium]